MFFQSSKSLRARRVQLSYYLVFGRFASADEIRYWTGRSDARNWDVQTYVNTHVAFFLSSQGNIELEATIHRATQTAWGQNNLYRTTPQGTVYNRYQGQHGRTWRTFVDLVNLLTEELDRDKKFKESVVKQSYADVAITPKGSDVWGWVNGLGSKKPYAQMVAEHLIWKAGQQGKRISLSSSPSGIVAEAFQVGNAKMVAAGGGNMVAAGGGNMVAAGGGNAVPTGGGSIVLLIGNDGSTLLAGSLAIAQRLVGNDGASFRIDPNSLVRIDPNSLIGR